MTQNVDYIGIEESNVGAFGQAFVDGQAVNAASGQDAAAVLAELGGKTALAVDDTVTDPENATALVPALVLPAALDLRGSFYRLPALYQKQPVDCLSASARLRIAGFLSLNKNWDGVVLLQTRDLTHWVQISADEVVSFQSFLTGKLARLLGGGTRIECDDEVADTQAITDTMARPERLASHLRSAEISQNVAGTLGHLIGAELMAARPYWLGQQLTVISDETSSAIYCTALEAQGVPVHSAKSTLMRDAGFAALWASITA